ncbi:MAG: glycosyltransferase, partial [Flavobacteriaceae bacterium]|nr:glycosyltransferase [Flavobacteriaceae bacterium]
MSLSMNARILFICPDIIEPIGGVKQIYRQVDVLNSLGYKALVVHQNHGFKPKWFEFDTPIEYHYMIHAELNNQPAIRPQWYVKLREAQLARNDLKIEDSDILVFPEAYGPQINQVYPSHSKVIYNQNCYHSFRKFPIQITKSETPYTHSNTLATFVNSDDSINYLKLAFGHIPIYKIHHYINTNTFKPTTKKKQIIYMSRKNVEDIKQIIQINALRNNLNDWVIKDLNHLSHEEIILAMNESSIFLSSNLDEGFSLPSIEAMASGCLVIGYPGKGGKEYFKSEFSMPVPEKDIQQFA